MYIWKIKFMPGNILQKMIQISKIKWASKVQTSPTLFSLQHTGHWGLLAPFHGYVELQPFSCGIHPLQWEGLALLFIAVCKKKRYDKNWGELQRSRHQWRLFQQLVFELDEIFWGCNESSRRSRWCPVFHVSRFVLHTLDSFFFVCPQITLSSLEFMLNQQFKFQWIETWRLFMSLSLCNHSDKYLTNKNFFW